MSRPAGPDEQQAAIVADDLQSVLPRLSDAGRTVLTLHYLEGFGLADIAGILHVPPGTVKSRLHAARNELKTLWIKETMKMKRRYSKDHR